jgi:flavin-dependent dehydrogenase
VDRASFDSSMRALAIGAGASVHSCATVRDVRRSAEGFALAVDGADDRGPTDVRARVVVDASGRSAFVAQRLGSVRRRCDNLVGIALRFERREDAAPATIEPASLGWWHTSAIAGSRTAAVFLTDADLLTRTFVGDADGWRKFLAGAPLTESRLGSAKPLGKACAFASATHVLDRAAGEGWLAVGDVAIGCDPIFGSGIDFALASAEFAAHTVVRAFSGSHMAWREYDARISRDAQAYLEKRARFYEETPWPDAPFWRRRHGWRAAA